MHIINKGDDRRERQEKILRDFGHNPQTAGREAREQAEHIAETCREVLQKGRKG
jgi:hypothetical protein